MTWRTIFNPDTDIVHVTPVGDDIDHLLGADCACKPTCEPVEHEDGTVGWLYVHHSADGRE